MDLLSLTHFDLNDETDLLIVGDWIKDNFPCCELYLEVLVSSIQKHLYQFDDYNEKKSGSGNGLGNGSGNGTGYGSGIGSGTGYGYGNGSGNGSGFGSGNGYGLGTGLVNGNGFGSGLVNGSGMVNGNGNGTGSGNGYGIGSLNSNITNKIPDISLSEKEVMINSYVVIRTYSAGVHCGILKSVNNTTTVLAECSNIHRWSGANTCKELALHGADIEYTRISEPVPLSMFTETIEIIGCSKEAESNLRQSRWGSD